VIEYRNLENEETEANSDGRRLSHHQNKPYNHAEIEGKPAAID
jgi:hypothetical protein